MAGPYTPNPNDPSRPYNSDEVQYGAEELRKLKERVGGAFACNKVTASTYTLLSTDVGNMVEMVNGGTLTIPTGLSAGLIGITGAASTTIAAASGVTLRIESSLAPQLYGANAFAVIMRTAANEWLIAGNLAFAST